MLTRDVIDLLQRSPTFRSQCDRIAAARHVRIALTVAHGPATERARTTLNRYEAGAIRAEVVLHFGEDYRELLAHEFEHILEQMDGVNLREEVARGRAWVLDGGFFETRRAFAAGVQALRECDGVHAHAAAVHETR